MPGFWKELFSTDGFMPHGHCYLWQPELVWLHVISDAMTALAYTSIPFTLLYFVRKRRDVPFHGMFLCFGVFIIACGTTHVMEIWTLWTPTYWLSGVIKAITALASVPTAILLIKLVPRALTIPTPQQLARAHREAIHQLLQQREADAKFRALLEAANHDAGAANAELEAFSYAVAHDLRTPLRSLNGYSTALLEDYGGKLGPLAKQHLTHIVTSAQRMSDTIDALLSLSRLTRTEPQLQPVDLTELGHAVIGQLRASEPTRVVDFIATDGLLVHGDPQLLRLVLENLLGNAWKFTGKQPAARVELGQQDVNGTLAYYVRDNGAGFDMASVDKLFAPFARLHRHTDFAGTGLGLATVHRIVRRHGGRIWAEAVETQGATFRFTLPTLPPP
jgi:signal transduction histidine kinase